MTQEQVFYTKYTILAPRQQQHSGGSLINKIIEDRIKYIQLKANKGNVSLLIRNLKKHNLTTQTTAKLHYVHHTQLLVAQSPDLYENCMHQKQVFKYNSYTGNDPNILKIYWEAGDKRTHTLFRVADPKTIQETQATHDTNPFKMATVFTIEVDIKYLPSNAVCARELQVPVLSK